MTHKPKTAFDEFSHLVELVPGVFIDGAAIWNVGFGGHTSVHIVDRAGEIATWNSDEVAEDPMTFMAAITAVALAAKYQADFCRTNLENNGQCVTDMIAETRRYVERMPPLQDHKMGYTEALVNEILDDRGVSHSSFWAWMYGQTMGVTETGVKVVYPIDLFNFLNNGHAAAPITD
jgi:hypothetical protein